MTLMLNSYTGSGEPDSPPVDPNTNIVSGSVQIWSWASEAHYGFVSYLESAQEFQRLRRPGVVIGSDILFNSTFCAEESYQTNRGVPWDDLPRPLT